MDGIGGIVILALIWIIGAAFGQKKKQEERRREQAAVTRRPSVEVQSVSDEPRSDAPDASQREGGRLEQILRQLNPELADLANQARAESRRGATGPTKPQRRSVPVRDPADAQVAARDDGDSFMAKAERAIARRKAAATEHIRERTDQDHAAFHQSAQRPDAVKVIAALADPPTLAQAIIWREILGPPVALREEEDHWVS